MSRYFIIVYGLMCFIVLTNREIIWKDHLFAYDKSGYHLYLPAIVIHNDLRELKFYEQIDSVYNPTDDIKWYSITFLPEGGKLNKYPLGVSILDLPFFLIAHLYTITAKSNPADGYSVPYQYATCISTIIWVCIGLFYLRRLLLRTYNEQITLWVLIAIALGTNIYYYTAFDQGMSHPYSFFLFAAALCYTDEWYRFEKNRSAMFLAIVTGLIVITRPSDGLMVFMILFWRVNSIRTLKERLQYYQKHVRVVLLAAALFALVLFIQFGYWKYVTGDWIYYSYTNEHFLWREPKIFEGLFGYRKGWFIYSPIAFIAALGFFNLWKKDRKMVPSLIIFLLSIIYVTFCWWNWWYGGGFGSRPLIDILPVMALPLAALLNDVFSTKKTYIKLAAGAILTFFVFLNIFQSYQAAKMVIHVDRMTKEYYWRVFLKLESNDEDYQYLLDDKTYWDGYRRIDR
jgi:hypothetical protein